MKFVEAFDIIEDFKAELIYKSKGDIILLTQEEYYNLIEAYEIIEHVILRNIMGERVLPPVICGVLVIMERVENQPISERLGPGPERPRVWRNRVTGDVRVNGRYF